MNPKLFTLGAMALFLSACSMMTAPPSIPSGSNRVPVNHFAPVATKPAAITAEPIQATQAQSQERPSFVLEGKTTKGKAVKVSLFSTLQKIADKTGLRFVDYALQDEVLEIVPAKDPVDVLRQLARKSRYTITFDREQGRLWVGTSKDKKDKKGLIVIKDNAPVMEVGSPIALKKLPKDPVSLTEAIRLLAPDDFDVGYAENLDPNIEVDLSSAKTWREALEHVALQTPYRIVFDWDKRIVYAVSVLKKG